MAKPRNSVLYMFDPLHQAPSTPRRDSSDELGPSDKENDCSDGDLTIFFSRTYASHKQSNVQPHTPKGKLVDIGDTPIPERLWDAAEHDGSDADGEQSESDAEGACSVFSLPRAPLAELDVEHTPKPQEGSRALKPLVFPTAVSPSQHAEPLPSLLMPAPQSSPLSEVVNSINFASMVISEEAAQPSPGSTSQETSERTVSRPSSPFPEINVCAPETPQIDESEFPKNPNDGLVAMASHLRPPSTLTQLSPDDPRRTSIDLYSSFHMQMQSADMSFDLLNDKVSFLGGAQDSFWGNGDDTLDFSEFCVPPAMKAKLENLVPPADPVVHASVFSPPTKASYMPPVMSPTTETATKVPLPLSPVFSAPPSRNNTPPRLAQPAFDDSPPSPPTSPVVADEPSLLLESEPLPPPIPAPIPALRIIKKTFKLAGHQSSAGPTLTSKVSSAGQRAEGSAPVSKRRSSIAPKPILPAPAPPASRPVIRGVQRPPPSMQAAGGVIIGLPRQGSAFSNATSTTSTTSTSSSGESANTRTTRPAQAAAAVSRFAGIQRPNPAARDRIPPRAPAIGIRPASSTLLKPSAGAVRGMSVPRPLAGAPSAGAMRPPSRTASGTTALPKPASRLPGPTGLTRTASMSSGSSAATGGLASRSRASTFSRATGRF